jgi:hypothetical protein
VQGTSYERTQSDAENGEGQRAKVAGLVMLIKMDITIAAMQPHKVTVKPNGRACGRLLRYAPALRQYLILIACDE